MNEIDKNRNSGIFGPFPSRRSHSTVTEGKAMNDSEAQFHLNSESLAFTKTLILIIVFIHNVKSNDEMRLRSTRMKCWGMLILWMRNSARATK